MSYLSKKGYVIRKDSIDSKELFKLKTELVGKPLVNETGFKTTIEKFPVYIETRNKIYIPKMYGIQHYGTTKELPDYIGKTIDPSKLECKCELYDNQIEPVNLLMNSLEKTGGGILSIQTGGGKCMKINTPILMFDGTVKMVQDIDKGELLMGDDSTPRRVLSLARGVDLMYEIIPVKGESYTVNQEHILCFKNTKSNPWIQERKLKNSIRYDVCWWENNKSHSKVHVNIEEANIFLENIRHKHQSIVEISVKDYLKQTKTFKHHFKGYRVPIEFPHKDLEIDPYMLGFWLGDGNSSASEITTQDSTVIKYFKENLGKYKCYLQYKEKYDYRINGDGSMKANSNFFNTFLRQNNLIKNKHIPMSYKCNSRENRLKLLAGLIDSDGSLEKTGFDFSQKSEKLIEDVIYLCRSLGFACYKSKQRKGCWYKGKYMEDDYYRISIFGQGTDEIPTLCPRKRAKKRGQIKDVLRTGIRVKEVGIDNYYGFEIDGNRRYVMGDFTVTHNTASAIYVLSKLGGKTIVVVNKIPLMNQWVEEINKFLPNVKVGTLQGQKNVDILDCDIVVAMLQSLVRIDYPDVFFEDFNTTVLDECHNYSSRIFSKVVFKLTSKYTIGLSATPNRADGCEYIMNWHIGDIVYKSTEAVRKSKEPIIKFIKIDSSKYIEEYIINQWTGAKTLQFTTMLSHLVKMESRNKLIVEIIKDTLSKEPARKILVLSDRRNHLENLVKTLDTMNDITFTYGLCLGNMKKAQFEVSRSSQCIFATFAAFSEGVSEKDLDTLFLITPKKYVDPKNKNNVKKDSGKLNQIIGRIFRKDHTVHPIIVDINDNFSVYKSQFNTRKVFYKSNLPTAIYENYSINLDNGEPLIKNSTKIQREPEHKGKLITDYCLLD